VLQIIKTVCVKNVLETLHLNHFYPLHVSLNIKVQQLYLL